MVEESRAKQGREGRRTLGVLELSLALIVACFAAMVIIVIVTTRGGRDGAGPVPQAEQPDPGHAPVQGTPGG